ncbi:condensation domain-containing protein [Dactylosporangium sp. NPDC051484]|uniref:condensation domain-containing protein n=1 Tax=Dactylosporangium sp. NPDC051484 TaxID=3154942 RepID=UPI00344FBC66
MSATVRRHEVMFAGAGDGEGDLSWGQIDIWLSMAKLGHAMAMGGVRPLPEGTSVTDVEAELRYVMSRYQTMRTQLAFDAAGWPRQVVHAAGVIDLEVFDAGSDEPEAVAAAIEARYRDEPFDYTTQWPLRMAVVCRGDACLFIVMIASHIALDGAAAAIMMRESDSRSTAPVAGTWPIDQAREQAGPAGQRQNAAALRHWDRNLRAIPVPRMPPSRDPRQPRHWTGLFRSAALPKALHAAASQDGLDAGAALLATFALAFARVGGPAVLPLRITVGNRFRPALTQAVGPVSQAGLCVIDTDGDFREVLRRAHAATLAACKYAYFDRRDLERLLATIVAERGAEIELDVSVNDRRSGGNAQDVPAPAQSSFEWLSAADGESSALFLNVDGSDEAIAVTVYLDSHFLAPGDAEAMLWAMEEIALAAAVDVAAAAYE